MEVIERSRIKPTFSVRMSNTSIVTEGDVGATGCGGQWVVRELAAA